MTHDVIRHLLDDYVTGDLPEDARGPVAAHVASCGICSAEVADLERILARARELPRSIDPPAAAWAGIKSAIERDKIAVGAAGGRSSWLNPAVLAAAAVLVAILSSGVTYAVLKTDSPARMAATGSPGSEATPSTLAAFTLEENNYLRTATMLQDLLEQQQHALAPETVAQLKASLRTIDEAILEARNALARDPANKMLIEMLSANYRQKVDLLRRTTEMTRGS